MTAQVQQDQPQHDQPQHDQPQQDQPKVVKINDAIYMAPLGANVYLVTTPAGNVVIDTGTSGMAPDGRRLLGAESHGPVKYIILTHGHADHIGGIGLWKEPGTQIIAQRNYVELVNYVARLEGFFAPRNAAAFNRPPQEAGPWKGNYGAKIDPTILFDETYEFTLGGNAIPIIQHTRRDARSFDGVDSEVQDSLHW